MSSNKQHHHGSWSDLPEELLHLILIRLDIREHQCFQSVCERWRAATKQLKKCIYCLLLKCDHCHIHSHVLVSPSDDRLYRLKSPETFHQNFYLGSFHGWLSVIPSNFENTIFLFNPFTGSRIDLPSWDSTLSIDHFKLSSAPTDPNCIVTMIEDSDRYCFLFCRVGDDEWTKEDTSSGKPLDILVFRGKFYLLLPKTLPTSTTTSTEHFKREILRIPFPEKPGSDADTMRPYLVESDANILLVLKGYRNSPFDQERVDSFVVFRLNLSTLSWENMTEIGNRVLFLGHCCSLSLPAAELGLRGNQICFIEEDDNTIWVFDMEDRSIKFDPVHYPRCIHCVNSMWIIPSFV